MAKAHLAWSPTVGAAGRGGRAMGSVRRGDPDAAGRTSADHRGVAPHISTPQATSRPEASAATRHRSMSTPTWPSRSGRRLASSTGTTSTPFSEPEAASDARQVGSCDQAWSWARSGRETPIPLSSSGPNRASSASRSSGETVSAAPRSSSVINRAGINQTTSNSRPSGSRA